MNRTLSLIIGLVFVLYISFSESKSSSLYSPDDPLYELNSTTFQPIVFGKNKAWTIQFYNSWCGHCKRFAPTFKEFARDVQAWRNVMDIGVIDCNEDDNVPFCRQYGIEVFPTIKHFWVNVTSTDLGEVMTAPRDIPSIEASMINFLEANWNKGVPREWPLLSPLQDTDLQSLADTISGQSIFLFIEEQDSMAGRKIILDLHNQKEHVVKRVLSTSNIRNQLSHLVSEDSLPALIKLSKDNDKEVLLRFFHNKDDAFIRDRVFEEIMNKERKHQLLKSIEQQPTSTEASVFSEKNLTLLHLTDLENALHSSLYQEIGLVKEFDAERISALKAYLSLLKKYFPGTKPVRSFLVRLHDWLSYRTHSVTGEGFVRSMKKITTEDAFLPDMRDWVKCKGSQPKYRGYPCSLWSLFHWLTVQADMDAKQGGGVNNGHALFIIKDYVANFFTCAECKNHFLELSRNVGNEVKTSKDAVLWLWRAHNNVNRRLAGDPTEDPKNPKVQFPTQTDCPTCYNPDNSYNTDMTYEFLLQFYSVPWLRGSDSVVPPEPIPQSSDPTNGADMVNSSLLLNSSSGRDWTFRWFTSADVSLCVSLYLVSALLLVLICLLFQQNRRKRRNLFGRYFSLYNKT